jgi:hydrogenase nickel incorporation protein HypB
MAPRIVEVRQAVLTKNDLAARQLRAEFAAAGTCVVSLVSSPGSGKTMLLGETLRRLTRQHRVAVLVGDLATDHDAVRLRASGAPVRQITTGSICHLDAPMVQRALADWDLAALDVLFIENVGNLVCPAAFDLGEDVRVVLVSVTEGEDKPEKYPTIFTTADAVVITKVDLAAAVEYNTALARRALDAVCPGVVALPVSAKSGQGMEAWLAWLESAVAGKRARHPARGST